MPSAAVLQIAQPATLLTVARNKGTPSVIREQKSILEMCISEFGDKELQQQQLASLRKLKPPYRHLSKYEKMVARQEIIPTRPALRSAPIAHEKAYQNTGEDATT